MLAVIHLDGVNSLTESNVPVFIFFTFRPSENMLIRVNNDGTYCANWTPGAIGLYTIHVTIDGIEIGIFF